MDLPPIVDLAFPITAGEVPIDHGYLLYAAVTTAVSGLHGAEWLGVHPLHGSRVGNASLMLTPRSAVTLRLPAEQIPLALALSGREVRIGAAVFRLAAPNVRPMQASSSLFARQVVVRLTSTPRKDGKVDSEAFQTNFVAELNRQLEALSVHAVHRVVARRSITVKDQRIMGFSIQLDGLSDEDSLRVQVRGLGGKRRMGCGIFLPARKDRKVLSGPTETEGDGDAQS